MSSSSKLNINYYNYDIEYLYLVCKFFYPNLNNDLKKKDLIKLLKNKIDVSFYKKELELNNEQEKSLDRNINVGGLIPVNTYLIKKELTIEPTNYIYKEIRYILKNNIKDKTIEKKFEKMKEFLIKNKNIEKNQVKNDIKNLNEIILNSPIPDKDIILYRGEHGNNLYFTDDKSKINYTLKIDEIKKGNNYNFGIFSYFSLNPLHSLNFADLNCCMFRLKIKKNTYPIFATGNNYQFEYIFSPKTTFKIDKITKIKSSINKDLTFKLFDISINKLF